MTDYGQVDYAQILAECLEAIETGRMTPGECLRQYPQYRQELAALLQTAALIQSAPLVKPSAQLRSAARARLIAQVAKPRPVTFLERARLSFQAYYTPKAPRRLVMTWIVVIGLLVGMISGGGALAAGQALPGEALYPLKTVMEDARLALANDAGDVGLLGEQALSRVQEIEALAAQGSFDEIPGAVTDYLQIAQELAEKLYTLSQEDWSGEEIALVQEALGISQTTLTQLREVVPEEFVPYIDQALAAAELAQEVVDLVFTGGELPEIPQIDPSLLPPIEIPPIEIPPLEMPPVEIPPIELPEVPPVEVPPVEVPPIEAPPIELPPVEVPPIELPPVELPSIELPSIPLPAFP